MSKSLHPIALFRLMVLGPLASRGELKRGEVKAVIRELASKTHNIPGSRRVHLSEQTILRWYYDWKRGGIEALNPSQRSDKGKTKLPEAVQAALLQLKQDNPARSINTMIEMLERQGVIAKNKLARATVHRFLQRQKLSKRVVEDLHTIERRSFVADRAGDIWHGDVLHGPSIQTANGMKKTYLVSLLDDASRLIAHSAFCLGETALDIEGVLKQAILKRGLPHKIIIDNGSAYRAGSLQTICAHLDIRLVYCRPYEPQGKGKLERFHSTFRGQFLNEIDMNKIASLDEMNSRLWAWLEQVYHQRTHTGLGEQAPVDAWRADLIHVRPLTAFIANKIDDIFCHRFERRVRKDGTVSWNGMHFEVSYHLSGEKVTLVVDPHTKKAIRIESAFGDDLGPAIRLDLKSNLHRKRQRPHSAPEKAIKQGENAVDLAHREYSELCSISISSSNKDK
jgi:transposase InsO family protein